jgi:predicted TIM-barrel fold metal-dependent hydrolase
MAGTSRRFLPSCACCDVGSSLTRRSFIAQAVAAGAATVLPSIPAQADDKPTKIDVHHHFAPDFHRDAVNARRGGLRWPKWSPQMSLDDMDSNGIATAMLSVVQPGTWFGNVEETRKLTRQLNDYAAGLSRDHPGRFGLFACIAPPDTEGSLKEIEYAFETLHADGIGLLTSYGTLYLGDPSFAPVYAELNRRKAIVYVHPIAPNCCKNLVPGIPVGSIEYATDTTRTIAHLVFSGTTTRFPDIRWIFSHSGGTLPFLTGRFTRLAGERKLDYLPNRAAAGVPQVPLRTGAGQHAGEDRGAVEDGGRWNKFSTGPIIRSVRARKSPPASPPTASAPPSGSRSSVARRSTCCRGLKRKR